MGLNLPEHVFIVASANVYKPISIVWKYGTVSTYDARCYEATLALQQAIGRNARKSQVEIKKGLNTSRIVLISKGDVFPNISVTLAQYSTEFYNDVKLVDLSIFKNLLLTQFKSGHLNESFRKIFILLKQNSQFKELIQIGGHFTERENVSPTTIRFNLIKEFYGIYKDKDLDVDKMLAKYIKFCTRYKIYALCGYFVSRFLRLAMELTQPGCVTQQQEKILEDACKDMGTQRRNLQRKFNIDRLYRDELSYLQAEAKALFDLSFTKLENLNTVPRFLEFLEPALKEIKDSNLEFNLTNENAIKGIYIEYFIKTIFSYFMV